MNRLGVGNLEAYYSISGFDNRSFVNHSAVTVDGKLQGILGLLETPALNRADFDGLPGKSLAALSLQLDGNKAFEHVSSLLKRASERDYQRFQQDLATMETALGVKVQEEFLAALGKRWQIYTSPDTGGCPQRSVNSVLRAANRIAAIHNNLRRV